MRLGIYSYYGRNEETMAAVRLASAAARYGWEVDWIAPAIQTPTHPLWDGKVVNAANRGLGGWARACDMFVWFAADQQTFSTVKSCSRSSVKHILVPPIHRMRPDNWHWVGRFDEIACPDRRSHNMLASTLVPAACAVRLMPWSPGVRRVQKQFSRVLGKPSVLIHADSFTWRRVGPGVCRLAAWLATAIPGRVSLSIEGSPTRREWSLLEPGLARGLGVGCRLTLPHLLTQVHDHDWLVLPSLRHDIGLLAKHAMACSVPVIGWDVHPLSSIVRHQVDGVLIDGGWSEGQLGQGIARFDEGLMYANVQRYVADSQALIRFQTECFHRSDWNDEDFLDLWLRTLELQAA